MTIRTAVLAAALTALAVPMAWSADQPAEPPAALSPQMAAGLKQLTSESFQERQQAMATIQKAMADQFRVLVTQDNPEVQARLATLIEAHDSLCRWALEVMNRPVAERRAALDWGLQPEVSPVIAKVFSAKPERRLEGIHELGKIKDAEATRLLAAYLLDDNREVYLAAMEAVWDREPTREVVDALWGRAIDPFVSQLASSVGMAVPLQRAVAVQPANRKMLKFRGQVIGLDYTGIGGAYNTRQLDPNVAADVLIHLKPKDLTDRLKATFDLIEQMSNHQTLKFSLQYNWGVINAYRMAEECRPQDIKTVVPILYRMATAQTQVRNNMNFNNQMCFTSNRTAAVASLAKLTGQSLDDLKIRRFPNMNNAVGYVNPQNYMWTAATEQDEDAAVKKIEEWWSKNQAQYAEVAASQPATAPAAAPAPANAPAPGARLQINGNVIVAPPGGAIHIQGNGGAIQVQVQMEAAQDAPAPAPQPKK